MFNKTIIYFLGVWIICLSSCQTSTDVEDQIAKIPIDIAIDRFDALFANAAVSDLPLLKNDYPFLFPAQYDDDVWTARMQDTLQHQLFKAVDSVFYDFKSTELDLYKFYQHLSYYHGLKQPPKIITVISDIDYRNKVVVTDSIVLIGLDNYLGNAHPFYANFYNYIKQNLTKTQLVMDLATAYSERFIYPQRRMSFLDEIIYYGKQLYLKKVWVPESTAAQRLGYTLDQYEWARVNEINIWQFFIENELLFDTNPKLLQRFINPAPFSRFNLELDNESPGQLGRFIGGRIVQAFMDNTSTPLDKMLRMDAQQIFNNAKYKPKK